MLLRRGVPGIRLASRAGEGSPAVVVVVYHLPFIQRQDVLFRLRQEEAAIRGHVEQALSEFNPPRIFFHILPHQDGCAAVELAAQAGVFATPEERAGARIRVDQGKVLCRHRKMAPFVCQLPRVDQVVGEVRLFRRRQGECAKALAAVHIREKFLPVLKVVERGQLSALHNGLEKALVESSVAMPVGTMNPARPSGRRSWPSNSAKRA